MTRAGRPRRGQLGTPHGGTHLEDVHRQTARLEGHARGRAHHVLPEAMKMWSRTDKVRTAPSAIGGALGLGRAGVWLGLLLSRHEKKKEKMKPSAEAGIEPDVQRSACSARRPLSQGRQWWAC